MKCMYNKLHLSLDEWKLWGQIQHQFTNLFALVTSHHWPLTWIFFWQSVWPSRRVSLERSQLMTTESVTTFLMTSLSHLCTRTIHSPTKQTVSRWNSRQNLGATAIRHKTCNVKYLFSYKILNLSRKHEFS